MQGAVLLGLLLGGDHRIRDFRFRLLVALLRPGAAHDEVVLQPDDRVSERPDIGFRLGAVGGRVVGRGMSADPVGHVLDQRRAEIAACALRRPFGDRMDGQIIVAVDPQGRNAEAEAAGRECAGAAPGDALKRRDRPLIVDDIEDDRRLVGRGEDQRGVEVALRRRAVADPADGDLRVVLDGRSHRPADGLDVLRRQVPGDGEEAMVLRGVEDRKLTALQRVPLVRVDLAHHLDERIAARDQQSGLAVGREIHVAGQKGLAERAADRLLAHVLHVEGRLPLPLRHLHSRVERAQRHHVPQSGEQLVVAEEPGPGTHRLSGSVEDADHRKGEIADRFRVGVHLRAGHGTCFRDLNVRKIRGIAGPNGRFGDMEGQGSIVVHRSSFPPDSIPRPVRPSGSFAVGLHRSASSGSLAPSSAHGGASGRL